MTVLHFTKMHGIGNDFMIVNNLDLAFKSHQLPVAQLSDRRFGIGFDQLLILEPSTKGHYACRIFNADGSEAEQCGNGLRCLARLIHEDLNPRNTMTIETKAGLFPIDIIDYDHITLKLTPALLEGDSHQISVGNQIIDVHKLSMGNPHAIVKVTDLEDSDFVLWAEHLSKNPLFPDGVNVGFMKIESKNHIYLRTFERGVGETFACGSNACAAAVTGILHDWLNSPVTVQFKKGQLQIKWPAKTEPLWLTGPAERVFNGVVSLD